MLTYLSGMQVFTCANLWACGHGLPNRAVLKICLPLQQVVKCANLRALRADGSAELESRAVVEGVDTVMYCTGGWVVQSLGGTAYGTDVAGTEDGSGEDIVECFLTLLRFSIISLCEQATPTPSPSLTALAL